MILAKSVMVRTIKHVRCWAMVHFLKLTDDDGYVSYVNMDLIVEVDVEEREITLVNGTSYVFDDDLNDKEWYTLMRYVDSNEYK